ncbi:hypothetical protein V6N13_107531 [Hibiscus sabdariffa]|uniref:RNase H type-1 domain-containing protein n=1 Tax=Hibiscus sabdariffa TaxID=183260 RepID=A0ABR2SQC7_9ROSI
MVSDNHVASGSNSLVHHIVRLLNRDWYVSLSHFVRETNSVAVALAKMDSRSVGGYGIFSTLRSVVCEVLRQDMQANGAVVARASQEIL